MIVLGDGRVAVTLRDRNEVVLLDSHGAARPLAELCTASVPTEPVSLALAGKDLLVTSAWARRLTALDVTGEPRARFSVALPREPRAVVVAADGRRAFVSHVVGAKMSVVDLDGDHGARALSLGVRAEPVSSGAEADRTGCQGFALATWTRGADERVFAPMVAVSPRGGEADPFGITVIGGGGYYGYTQRDASLTSPPKETPLVSVVEGSREEPLTTTVAPLGARLGSECLLPRAAAVRASTGGLFVTCLGVDVVLELDARGKDPARLERRRVHVATGPTGVAIDDARGEAIVWSQFAPKLTVVPLDGPVDQPAQPVAIDVDYAPVGMTEAFAAGRLLFHRSADLAITRDGMACASCHPDARDDAITWTTPEGPRQTIPLAGRTDGAAPYGWPGQHATLTTYIANTVNRLGGLGLGPVELDALAAYVRGARSPRRFDLRAGRAPRARQGALQIARAGVRRVSRARRDRRPAARRRQRGDRRRSRGLRHAVAPLRRRERALLPRRALRDARRAARREGPQDGAARGRSTRRIATRSSRTSRACDARPARARVRVVPRRVLARRSGDAAPSSAADAPRPPPTPHPRSARRPPTPTPPRFAPASAHVRRPVRFDLPRPEARPTSTLARDLPHDPPAPRRGADLFVARSLDDGGVRHALVDVRGAPIGQVHGLGTIAPTGRPYGTATGLTLACVDVAPTPVGWESLRVDAKGRASWTTGEGAFDGHACAARSLRAETYAAAPLLAGAIYAFVRCEERLCARDARRPVPQIR